MGLLLLLLGFYNSLAFLLTGQALFCSCASFVVVPFFSFSFLASDFLLISSHQPPLKTRGKAKEKLGRGQKYF